MRDRSDLAVPPRVASRDAPAAERAGAGHLERSEAGHPSPERGHVTLGRLWFGLFGAPAAWSVQTLADFTLASHACYPALVPRAVPTFAGLWWVLLAISLAMLTVEGLATAIAVQSWRATRHETGGGHHRALETGEGRTRFMALAGVLTSVLFLLVSLVHTAALFLVQPCGA